MAWQRWNSTTKIIELSTDNGENWNPLAIANPWPVGSIYISTVATNPATLLGFGTWTAFGSGRVLVGLDAGQTEFDVAEETGGEKTHTLIEDEIPAHDHGVTDPGHVHGVNYHPNAGSGSYIGGSSTAAPDGAENSASATTGIATQNAGGGQAHNNLQPYIVVYMWKRTA